MIQVLIENIDRTASITARTLVVEQALTSEVDTARFNIKKIESSDYEPVVGHEVAVFDGVDKIFGGRIVGYKQKAMTEAAGLIYEVECVDYGSGLNSILVTKVYENKTIAEIATDIIASFAPGYTANNVSGSFVVGKIVFNQQPIGQCLKKLADIVKYEWYVDPNKDLYLFPKFSNSAPFDLTDTSGNFIRKTILRSVDGSQVVNQVKVIGGQGDGELYTDTITVSGNETKAFVLPYQFSELQIWVNSGTGDVAKTVGIDGTDDETLFDCVYNFQQSTIRFQVELSDGDQLKFSGLPRIPVMSIVKDTGNILQFGLKEKLIKEASIIDMDTARKRARAELAAYKNPADNISFETYQTGLRAGMVIGVNSSLRNLAKSYLIKRLTFKQYTSDTFSYKADIETVSKYSLIEVLQRILNPDAGTIDDSMIAETIETDLSDIEITELIQSIAATNNLELVESTESVNYDPIGIGVEPIWVLGPYAPTSNGGEAFIDQQNDTSPSNVGIYVNNWRGQSFIVTSGINSLAQIKLKLRKIGTAVGNFVVDLYLADGAGKPTGSVLASSSMLAADISTTATIYDFIFNAPISPSTRYVFVCKADSCPNSTNAINVYYNGANPYPDGMYCASTNNGGVWSQSAPTDLHFIEYSQLTGDPKRAGRLDISLKLY